MPFKKGQVGNPLGAKACLKVDYKNRVIRKCWSILDREIRLKATPPEIKREIAKAICQKTCPQDGGGRSGEKVIIINQPRTAEAQEARLVVDKAQSPIQ